MNDPVQLNTAKQAVTEVVKEAVDAAGNAIFHPAKEPIIEAAEIEGVPTIEDFLRQLDLDEATWEKLARSEAGRAIRQAWDQARPILVAVTGAASGVLFSALAARVIGDKK